MVVYCILDRKPSEPFCYFMNGLEFKREEIRVGEFYDRTYRGMINKKIEVIVGKKSNTHKLFTLKVS